jgi:hypothetical protein
MVVVLVLVLVLVLVMVASRDDEWSVVVMGGGVSSAFGSSVGCLSDGW